MPAAAKAVLVKACAPLLPVTIVLMGGCGGAESPPSPGDAFPFEYIRAGGVGYSKYELRIEADGSGEMSYEGYPFEGDNGPPPQESFELTEDEVAEFAGVLEANPLGELPEPPEGDCPDGFGVTLAYGGEEFSESACDEGSEAVSTVREALFSLPVPPDPLVGG